MGTLFQGHKYTFKKDGSDLVMLDSTDHSHETITFREGIVASGSMPLEIKPLATNDGIYIRAHSNTDYVQKHVSYYATAQAEPFGLSTWYYANSPKITINADIDASQTIYAKAGENVTTRDVMLLENSSGTDLLKVRKDGKIYTDGGDFYVRSGTNHTRIHTTGTHTYIDYPSGDFHIRQSSGAYTRFRIDGSVMDKLGHLRPYSDNTYDVGASSLRWDDIRATNGNIQTSDRTLKEHISGSNLGLSFINDLNPVSYRWIGKNRNHYGLIAQEVSESLAKNNVNTDDFAGYIKDDIYHRTKQIFVPDNNDSGSYENEEDYQSVKEITNNPDLDISDYTYSSTTLGLRYAEFISPLIKAVQELSAEVTSLKARVTELENN